MPDIPCLTCHAWHVTHDITCCLLCDAGHVKPNMSCMTCFAKSKMAARIVIKHKLRAESGSFNLAFTEFSVSKDTIDVNVSLLYLSLIHI